MTYSQVFNWFTLCTLLTICFHSVICPQLNLEESSKELIHSVFTFADKRGIVRPDDFSSVADSRQGRISRGPEGLSPFASEGRLLQASQTYNITLRPERKKQSSAELDAIGDFDPASEGFFEVSISTEQSSAASPSFQLAKRRNEIDSVQQSYEINSQYFRAYTPPWQTQSFRSGTASSQLQRKQVPQREAISKQFGASRAISPGPILIIPRTDERFGQRSVSIIDLDGGDQRPAGPPSNAKASERRFDRSK